MNLENEDKLLVEKFKNRSVRYFKNYLGEHLYSSDSVEKIIQFLDESKMYPVEQKAYQQRPNKVFTLAYNNIRVGVLYASSRRVDFKLGLGSKKISNEEFYKSMIDRLFNDSGITAALLNLKATESEGYLREPIQFSYKVAISKKYSSKLSQIPGILYNIKNNINKYENMSDPQKILIEVM